MAARAARLKTPAPVILLLAASAAAATAAGVARVPRTDDRVQALFRGVTAKRAESDIRRMVGFGTRHTLSSRDHPERGIGAAQRWVLAELQEAAARSGGRMQVELDAFTTPRSRRVPQATEIANVVATLPGSEPDRVLVVSGHLDSRATDVMKPDQDSPGANDDASGVAVVLACARAMAAQRFRATVVFLVTTGEEQGLLGATHWAEGAKERKLGIEAVLNNDIVGNTWGPHGERDRRHVRVFSEGVPPVEATAAARLRAAAGAENDSPSRQLARAVADVARRYRSKFGVTLVYRRDRFLRGGDHVPFNDRGWAAVRFTEMSEDYRRQHQDVRQVDGVQYGDLPEFVDYGYVKEVARLNLAALADLAWAPPPPKRVRFVSRLEPGIRLRWDRSPDPDRLGYEVLWRATTAADWQKAQFVGDVGEVALPLSRDDLVFGVRAVGRTGTRSLASLAMPETAPAAQPPASPTRSDPPASPEPAAEARERRD